MIKFPHSYFDDELICDFYVPSMVKRTWAASVQLLADLDEVCRRNNIEYFAEWGILLGTIRHAGFIPWDDDLDICMKRPDYEKFLSVAEKELPEGYTIVNYRKTNGFRQMLSRLVNTDHYRFDEPFLTMNSGLPFAVGVDIFPMDFLSDDNDYEQNRKDKIYLLQETLDMVEKEAGNNTSIRRNLTIINTLFNRHLKITDDLSYSLRRLMEQVQSEVSEDEAADITLYSLWFNNGYKFPKKYYADSVRMPFENIDIPVPLYYDEILSRKYSSSYMTPVRSGGSHNYPYFQIHLDVLKEHFNYEWPAYHPDCEDLNSDSRQREPEFKTIVSSTVSYLSKSHSKISDLLRSSSIQEAFNLINECQAQAIHLGTLFEMRYYEGCEPVSILEDYCEALYNFSEFIIQSFENNISENFFTEISSRITALDQLSDSFYNLYMSDFEGSRVIMFISPGAKYLTCMLPLINKYLNLDNTFVKIMPIPHIEISPDMSSSNMVFDLSSYPDGYEYISYDGFDFTVHPDEIVVSYPYDEYNILYTTESTYYSGNLIHKTEKLTFIPFFDTHRPEKSDERSIANLKYCLLTPLTAICDEMLVNSRNAIEIYSDVLCQNWGNEYRDNWKKIKLINDEVPPAEASLNIKCGKAPAADSNEHNHPCPAKDKVHTKTLLYYIGINSFMSDKHKMMEKYKNCLEMFNKNAETLNVILLEQFCLNDFLPKIDSNLYNDYCLCRDAAVRQGIITLGTQSVKPSAYAEKCDAYYGEASYYVPFFTEHGKPVMIHNISI